MTLYGDREGHVIELGVTVSQPWRCEWEDKYGRCNNPKNGKHYCAWHEIILEESERGGEKLGYNRFNEEKTKN